MVIDVVLENPKLRQGPGHELHFALPRLFSTLISEARAAPKVRPIHDRGNNVMPDGYHLELEDRLERTGRSVLAAF